MWGKNIVHKSGGLNPNLQNKIKKTFFNMFFYRYHGFQVFKTIQNYELFVAVNYYLQNNFKFLRHLHEYIAKEEVNYIIFEFRVERVTVCCVCACKNA